MRIEGSRVELETVVFAFEAGSTPEEIAQDYPVLALNDVYAVLTYYLRHRDEVESYLRERRRAAEATRKRIEARSVPVGQRERLEARLRASA